MKNPPSSRHTEAQNGYHLYVCVYKYSLHCERILPINLWKVGFVLNKVPKHLQTHHKLFYSFHCANTVCRAEPKVRTNLNIQRIPTLILAVMFPLFLPVCSLASAR